MSGSRHAPPQLFEKEGKGREGAQFKRGLKGNEVEGGKHAPRERCERHKRDREKHNSPAREGVCVRERDSVCVRERECVCVCV